MLVIRLQRTGRKKQVRYCLVVQNSRRSPTKMSQRWPVLNNNQFLVMMLGVPGSGKSTFARQLEKTLVWQRFSTDAIKTELFGCPDPNLQVGVTESAKKKIDKQTFDLLNQRVEESLMAGHSVIRDHMHHKMTWRQLGCRQAKMIGALAVSVHIKTPHELAHQRGLTRGLKPDTRVETCPEKMWHYINLHHKALCPPNPSEIYLEIDGTISFNEQLSQFNDLVKNYL